MDHEVPRFQKTRPFHAHVARNLRHPTLIRMRRNSCNVNFPTADPNEKKDIERNETVQSPDLGGEEIRSKKISVRSNKLFPGRCLFPLGSRSQAISLQNISHCVIADLVSEIGQSSNDSVISQLRFSCAIRTINLSNSASVRGRPGFCFSIRQAFW